MSPRGSGGRRFRRGFPRVSGDEPKLAVTKAANSLFSPRERG